MDIVPIIATGDFLFVKIYINPSVEYLYIMSNATTGLKAGVVAGLVYGIIDGIFALLALIIFKSTVMATLEKAAASASSITGVTISAQTLYNIALIESIVVAIVAGIIGGLILGAIFGAVYNRIPGKSPPVRGIVFGFILWILLNVLLGIANIGTYGLTYYLFGIGGGLIAALIYGYIAGMLFGKWNRPIPKQEELQTFP